MFIYFSMFYYLGHESNIVYTKIVANVITFEM